MYLGIINAIKLPHEMDLSTIIISDNKGQFKYWSQCSQFCHSPFLPLKILGVKKMCVIIIKNELIKLPLSFERKHGLQCLVELTIVFEKFNPKFNSFAI